MHTPSLNSVLLLTTRTVYPGNAGDERYRPQTKTPFSIMAPLDKFAETMMKLSDRIHKRRISEDGDSSQSSKQPKKTPTPSTNPLHLLSPGWNLPGLPPSLHLPKPCHLLIQAPEVLSSPASTSSRASSSNDNQDSTGTPFHPRASKTVTTPYPKTSSTDHIIDQTWSVTPAVAVQTQSILPPPITPPTSVPPDPV